MKIEISSSVKDIVSFIYSTGNLESAGQSKYKLQEGTKNHIKIQKEYPQDSKSEVVIKGTIEYKEYIFNINGRIDGIHFFPELIIEEIKSSFINYNSLNLKSNMLYYAQLSFYSYLYCLENNINKIKQQLVYYIVNDDKKKTLCEEISFDTLEKFVYSTLNIYISWLDMKKDHKSKVLSSLSNLDFPYKNYRKGQYKMAKAIYLSIDNKINSYVQAPCGIGKTLGSIFPSLKAISENKCDKIFFSTSKNTQKIIANETLNILYNKGAYFRSIEITAKDKICLLDKRNCSPENCKYAKDYYEKLKPALKEILLNNLHLTDKVIKENAIKFEICPFELSLNLCNFSEIIICDYNYIFDPLVSLKSIFENTNDKNIFLIDEAHNLPDRTSSMFTKQLSKQHFLNVKKYIKNDQKILKSINNINKYFLKRKKEIINDISIEDTVDNDLISRLEHFKLLASSYLEDNDDSNLLELLLDVVGFLKIYEYYDETFKVIFTKNKRNLNIKIFNIDPKNLIKISMNKAISVNYFTATLTPVDYYKYMLNYKDDDIIIKLDSPFPRKNVDISILSNIELNYRKRYDNINLLAKKLSDIGTKHKGNQIFFFPSYSFMEKVYDIFISLNSLDTIIQSKSLNSKERFAFLNKFKSNKSKTLIGFCVLGGVFSEGIDLKGSSLTTCVIISISLPMICTERNLIKEYFLSKGYNGFDYAYVFNSITRILQASGRLIRSSSDIGNIIYIGHRFIGYKYLNAIKDHYEYIDKIK